MPGIYTEPYKSSLVKTKILENSNEGEIKNVSIIGCGGCANVSCSLYQGKDQPIMSIFMKPIAITKEMEIMKKGLEDTIPNINYDSSMGLCDYSKRKMKKIQKIADKADAVVVMSCPGGVETVKAAFPDKKIVSGMQLKGFKSIGMKVKGLKIYPNIKE